MTSTSPPATSTAPVAVAERPSGPEPVIGEDRQGLVERITLGVFIVVPFVALVAAVPIAWGWGLGWQRRRDRAGLLPDQRPGHHGRLPPLLHPRLVQGQPRAEDRPGDRRVAWPSRARSSAGWPTTAATTSSATRRATRTRRGATATPSAALIKGLFYAHMGWLFDVEQTPQQRYAPDLLKDRDIVRISPAFPDLVAVSLLLPAVVGGLVDVLAGRASPRSSGARWSASRLLHHVTWSINSICHAIGERRSSRRDQLRQRVVAGDPVVRRVLAQPPPRRPDLRPPRRAQGPDRHQRPDHLDLREARLGLRRALAEAPSGSPPAGRPERPVRMPARPSAASMRQTQLMPHRADDRWCREHVRRTVGLPEPPSRAACALPVPDDRQAPARATARRRPDTVRRDGLRRHLASRRSRPRPGSPSPWCTSTSAARKASTRSSWTTRSRACWTASPHALSSCGPPPRDAGAGRVRPAGATSRSRPTGFRILVRDSPAGPSTGTFASLRQRRRQPGRAHPGQTSSRPVGSTRKTTPLYAQMLVGMVALTGQWWLDAPQAEEGRGRRAPGQPGLERPVRAGASPDAVVRAPMRRPGVVPQ